MNTEKAKHDSAIWTHFADAIRRGESQLNVLRQNMPEMAGMFRQRHLDDAANKLAQMMWLAPTKTRDWIAEQTDLTQQAAELAKQICQRAAERMATANASDTRTLPLPFGPSEDGRCKRKTERTKTTSPPQNTVITRSS